MIEELEEDSSKVWLSQHFTLFQKEMKTYCDTTAYARLLQITPQFNPPPHLLKEYKESGLEFKPMQKVEKAYYLG